MEPARKSRSVTHDHTYLSASEDPTSESSHDIVAMCRGYGEIPESHGSGDGASLLSATFEGDSNCDMDCPSALDANERTEWGHSESAEKYECPADIFEVPCLSPLSALSVADSGYDSLTLQPDLLSQGESKDGNLDDLWNDSFSELFPTLV